MVNNKQYLYRELLGILIYPFVLLLIMVVLYKSGRIPLATSEVIGWFAAVSVAASILSFIVTYKMIFKKFPKTK